MQGILAHRERHGRNEYLVQWENCSYLQSTWEPDTGLAFAQRHLTAYHKKSRQIKMDVATVLLEDPSRLGRVIDPVPRGLVCREMTTSRSSVSAAESLRLQAGDVSRPAADLSGSQDTSRRLARGRDDDRCQAILIQRGLHHGRSPSPQNGQRT